MIFKLKLMRNKRSKLYFAVSNSNNTFFSVVYGIIDFSILFFHIRKPPLHSQRSAPRVLKYDKTIISHLFLNCKKF